MDLMLIYKILHFLTLYLVHFPMFYSLSNIPFPEAYKDTAWELSNPEKYLSFRPVSVMPFISPPPPPSNSIFSFFVLRRT
jgi:hypothetical protein